MNIMLRWLVLGLTCGALCLQGQTTVGTSFSVGQVSPGGQGASGQDQLGGISHVTRRTLMVAPQILARDFFNAGGVNLGPSATIASGAAGSAAVASAPATPSQKLPSLASAPRISAVELASLVEAARRGDAAAKARVLAATAAMQAPSSAPVAPTARTSPQKPAAR
jgi:hypothetical protein